MKGTIAIAWLVLALVPFGPVARAQGESDEGITWLVAYKADALPAPPQWARGGGDACRAEIVNGALHLADDSEDDMGCYRATWEAKPDQEIVVEAKVRVVYLTGYKEGGKGKGFGRLYNPWVTGSPIGILVSDGRRQEGLVLGPNSVSTFLDRFCLMETTDDFHVYRLVIRGGDMQVYVDGRLRIRGKDAFWKPAAVRTPFIQFGSDSRGCTGEAYWEYVRLGVRPATGGGSKEELKVTVGEPWKIPSAVPLQTRPYLYNVGRGLLLMSVAQGPDKDYEPFGILKSTDEGKTWAPVEGLQEKMFAPQPMIRLADGNILGASRWNVRYEYPAGKACYVGMTCLFDPLAQSFRMYENKAFLPAEATGVMVFDRHIFDVGGGAVLAAVCDQGAHGYLLRTTDQGKTWTHFSTIGKGHEPGVARISQQEWTALLRQGSATPFHQVWSHDGGKTWSEPAVLEEGSVDADIVVMADGVLAASYGRPGCSIMFSTDGGKTWGCHRAISELHSYNYTTLCEVRPGRLLYVHDAPPLTALYIDVERAR